MFYGLFEQKSSATAATVHTKADNVRSLRLRRAATAGCHGNTARRPSHSAQSEQQSDSESDTVTSKQSSSESDSNLARLKRDAQARRTPDLIAHIRASPSQSSRKTGNSAKRRKTVAASKNSRCKDSARKKAKFLEDSPKAKICSSLKVNECNSPRTRSQSRLAASSSKDAPTTPAKTPVKTLCKLVSPKVRSPPVALVSPSNSLLTTTSLSELSSSAFSLTSPNAVCTEEADTLTQEITHSADPSKWSVAQVQEFLRSRTWLAEYAPHFKAAEIDGRALALLHVDHLVSTLRMKLGPALKLRDLVERLKTDAQSAAPSDYLSSLTRLQCDSEDELNVEDL